MNFSSKIRDIHKIETRNFISINIFGFGEKEKLSIYFSKIILKRDVDFLSIVKKG